MTKYITLIILIIMSCTILQAEESPELRIARLEARVRSLEKQVLILTRIVRNDHPNHNILYVTPTHQTTTTRALQAQYMFTLFDGTKIAVARFETYYKRKDGKKRKCYRLYLETGKKKSVEVGLVSSVETLPKE